MGMLSNDYRKNLLKQMQQQPASSASPAIPVSTPEPVPLQQQAATAEKEAQRSTASRLPMEIGKSLGMVFPEQDEWDKMDSYNKFVYTGASALGAFAKIITTLPREIVKAPIRAGYSIYKPWEDLAKGKFESQEVKLFNTPDWMPPIGTYYIPKPTSEAPNVPWVGKLETYWDTYDSAIKSGAGPVAASLNAVSLAAGDISISASLGEAFQAVYAPKKIAPVGAVMETAPIEQVIEASQTKVQRLLKKESTSEYKPLPPEIAKKYGGNVDNTYFKVTPAGTDSVELAVVQTREGLIPGIKGFVKNKFGKTEKVYEGDLGREVKLESQIIKIQPGAAMGRKITTTREVPVDVQQEAASIFGELETSMPGTRFAVGETGEWSGVKSTFPDWLPSELRSNKLFDSFENKISGLGETGAEKIKFTKKENQLFEVIRERIAKNTGRQATDIFKEDLFSEVQTITIRKKLATELPSLLEKPLKGMADKPVTQQQISHLGDLAIVNKLDPAMSDMLMKVLTGKNVAGELTQAEYVSLAKTLSLFDTAIKYAPEAGIVSSIGRIFSPQRHWMRSLEQSTGIPLYSDIYVPMEDAMRIRNVFRNSYRNEAREIYGKYAKPGFSEERRLLKSYLEGDESVITENSVLNAATKKDLIVIAEKMRPLWDKLGEEFGVPRDVFLKNYQPHIQNIGGVYQLYKSGSEMSASYGFFAKLKRKGSLDVQVDDSLALFDIYVNAGSNSKFVSPVLERVSAMGKTLPGSLKKSVTSYVQEKMGYAGGLEEAVDKLGYNLNRRLGTNLPPDVGRQLTNIILDTVYSGGLSSPASWFRNFFQYDILVYPRLGPKFYASAAKKAVTKAGIDEVRQAGFLVDLGVPYGTELAEDITLAGKLGNYYRKVSQTVIKPFSLADNVVRTRTYFQGKYIFEDVINRYNAKKISWTQAEKELDLSSFGSADQNIIRQKLVKGDTKGAFNQYIRDIIDDTNFPYRRGSSSRITYGLTGKLGTTFMQWPIEFAHTMGRWASTGQWDKIIRWYAASSAIKRTLQDTFGWDFTRSVYLGPFDPSFSPFVQAGLNAFEALQATWRDNASLLEESKDALTRTLKTLGMPAGVEIQNIRRFWYSYNKGPQGPDGQYGIYDDRGRLRYYADFSELWSQLFGFPTVKKVSEAEKQKQMVNAQFEYSNVKKRVLEMYQREDYDKANELISEYGIQINSSDFDQYYIPLTQRTWNALPASLKAKFLP